MIIAIDYDGTYSINPELWNQIINLFMDAGYSVICVTGRTKELGQPVLDSIGKLVPVIFAGGLPKREACKNRGYNVGIWIDDMPEMITSSYLVVKV
jgi:hypothetical protein